jgi:hypothetical protein
VISFSQAEQLFYKFSWQVHFNTHTTRGGNEESETLTSAKNYNHNQFEVASPQLGVRCFPSDSRVAAAEVPLSSSRRSKEPLPQSEVTSHQNGELSSPSYRLATGAEVTLSSSTHLEEQVTIFLMGRRFNNFTTFS